VKALSLPAQPVAVAALLSACGDEAEQDRAVGQAVLLEALHRVTHLDDAAADVVLGMLLKR